MPSDQTPHPDAGGTTTKREVTLRQDETERVWVEWFVKPVGGSFTSILSERDGQELRVLSLDSNELSQMLLALDPEEDSCMVRDLGFQRVWVERSDGFVTLVVADADRRILVLGEGEVKKLIAAVERAEDELPRTEDDPHV